MQVMAANVIYNLKLLDNLLKATNAGVAKKERVKTNLIITDTLSLFLPVIETRRNIFPPALARWTLYNK